MKIYLLTFCSICSAGLIILALISILKVRDTDWETRGNRKRCHQGERTNTVGFSSKNDERCVLLVT